jgi:hypothetical protein
MSTAKKLFERMTSATGGGKPLTHLLLQGVLMRVLRRNRLGLLGTILVRKAMMGDGRLFGMDLASRRQARWRWLAALLQNHMTKTAAKGDSAGIRRRLSR